MVYIQAIYNEGYEATRRFLEDLDFGLINPYPEYTEEFLEWERGSEACLNNDDIENNYIIREDE